MHHEQYPRRITGLSQTLESLDKMISVFPSVANAIVSECAMASAEDRYRTLLDMSSTLADQPTVKAMVQSLRGLLTSTCSIHGAHLYILDSGRESLHLFEFDQAPDAPLISTGTKISRVGAPARVLEEQKPVFLPDLAQEMVKIPELARFAPESVGRSTYLFPVSTSQQRYGFFAVTKDRGQEFLLEDVELLGSLASHLAVALECAVARDSAERYQRQVAKERDRLKLLLDINNYIVSKLDINDLFESASASIRSYFNNDFTGFWLVDKKSNQLECVVLDFPSGKGFFAPGERSEFSGPDYARMSAHTPELWSIEEIEKLPAPILEKLRAESIILMALAPLVTARGPLGVITLGSRGPHSFSQEDLDLLSQISTQIALAVENAVAYGRVAAARDRLEEERLYLESEISSDYNFEDIIGKSATFRRALQQVSIVAPTDSTVLLHGETGTGKELIARAIHNLSSRRQHTFVRMNCAAIPSGLLESELFGHEKGAFTGALIQKKGRFELADQGSLFLDEIGDISLELQPKLLRAVQEQEFERLGSAKTIQVDVRMIAATHRDLPAMIRDGHFREDLFYRLNVFPIEIPPLRERRDDIPLLVHYFVSKLARRMRKDIKTIPRQAMDALTNSAWPGNVRELANFIERAVILTRGEELQVPLSELRSASRPGVADLPRSSFAQAERDAIIEALKAASGRISGKGGAAERLGLKRTTLQNKMRRLGIAAKSTQTSQ
ncbi:MAG: sigma 54-interacting transcriptional regulator [Candidatus Korobacteraceae bacterium]